MIDEDKRLATQGIRVTHIVWQRWERVAVDDGKQAARRHQVGWLYVLGGLGIGFVVYLLMANWR